MEARELWQRINKTTEELRELWRLLGEAFIKGKKMTKEQRENLNFSDWCKQECPGIHSTDISNAIWWAKNFSHWLKNPDFLATDHVNPKHIRQWIRDNERPALPAPSAELEFNIKEDVVSQPRFRSIEKAQKYNKLTNMAERGEGQERIQAEKYRTKVAKDMGFKSVQEATEAAKNTDPFYQVSAHQADTQQNNLSILQRQVSSLVASLAVAQKTTPETPIRREAVIALFDKLCDELHIL